MDFRVFLDGWNKEREKKRDKIVAQAVYLPNGRVAEIFFRFSPTLYGINFLQRDFWLRLKDSVEELSSGKAVVATDEEMFGKGILDLKISSMAYSYKDDHLNKLVHWLGNEFFPSLKI